MNCGIQRDETGWTCRPCGASWIGGEMPNCIKEVRRPGRENKATNRDGAAGEGQSTLPG
jgi:hypothetical protein